MVSKLVRYLLVGASLLALLIGLTELRRERRRVQVSAETAFIQPISGGTSSVFRKLSSASRVEGIILGQFAHFYSAEYRNRRLALFGILNNGQRCEIRFLELSRSSAELSAGGFLSASNVSPSREVIELLIFPTREDHAARVFRISDESEYRLELTEIGGGVFSGSMTLRTEKPTRISLEGSFTTAHPLPPEIRADGHELEKLAGDTSTKKPEEVFRANLIELERKKALESFERISSREWLKRSNPIDDKKRDRA